MKSLRLLLPAGLLVAVFIAKAANDGQAVALNAKRVVEALEVHVEQQELQIQVVALVEQLHLLELL